jgi:ligand-binding sensor domain-containing protein/signal transduction histidine kinase/DNA-binding response OmpR family regulator
MHGTDTNRSNRAVTFLLFFLFPIYLFGQGNSFFFRHLTTNEGLSHNSVYSIVEDNYGFIWIGTRSGLNRFDGYKFKVYDINNSGLRNAYINNVFKDSKGRIWVATQEAGLSMYDYNTDDFTTFEYNAGDPKNLSRNNIQVITEDSRGRIWAGSHKDDLYWVNETKGKLQRINLKAKLPANREIDRINSLLFENDSLLWLGTFSGLFCYNQFSGKLTQVSSSMGIVDARIQCIFNENKDKLWLGTNTGILRFDKKTLKPETITTSNSALSNDLILDIERYTDGRIMIATDGGGINLFNPANGSITQCVSDPNNPNSLSNNSVYEIFVDSHNGVWVGNYMGGVNYYSEFDWKFLPIKHQIDDKESLSDNHVRSFYQDRNGTIWIGTLGGLNSYNPASGKFISYNFSKTVANSRFNAVLAIHEDQNGLIWIGTFGGGIYTFDRKKNSFTKFSHPDDLTNSLDKSSIYSINATAGNKLCIASLGGIYLLDNNKGKLKRYSSSNSLLSNNTVKVLCTDRKGNLWLGTNQGLNCFNPETEEFEIFLHSKTDTNSIVNNRILSILEASDSKIWIGTEGGGISILNPSTGKFNSITSKDGLPDNVINAIIEDNSGLFWFSTNKGLVQYDQKLKRIKMYTISDGLQGNEFSQNAALKAQDGKLYFGGSNGFNAFFPGTLVSNTSNPRVLLTDLYISGKPVKAGAENSPLHTQLFLLKRLVLNYEQSNFELQFSALGTINEGKFKYSIFMKGVDKDWSEFRQIRSVNYANLRPGLYTFMVKAVNSDGVFSLDPQILEIRVLPPWWKSWWAFVIYSFLILGALIMFMRLNTSRLKVQHQLLLERREKDQIEELNQMKLGFFTNISHEFKTPLTLILGHLDNLKHAGSEKKAITLDNIEKNARRLLFLINQLLEFRKVESGLMKLKTSKGNIVMLLTGIKDSFDHLASKKNIRFEMHVRGSIPEIWFDAEKMEKILFNLLSNAFKYTDDGETITIEARVAEIKESKFRKITASFLEINIIDTGKGINPEEIDQIFDKFYQGNTSEGNDPKIDSSGIGLAYTKRLVELHYGSIQASSNPGKGSVFSVKLPLGKDHLKESEIKEEVSYNLKMDYKDISETPENSTPVDPGFNDAENEMPILLVIDDNIQICNVIEDKFKSYFRVITANSGEDGMREARSHLPDIIISDIMMPGMDGIELCRILKEDILTSHIPVILLTAKSGDENLIIGMKTGADAYISKPYNPDILEVTIKNLVTSRRMLRSKFSGEPNYVPAELVSNKLDEKFLTKIISLIENDIDSDSIDVTKLSREVAMSRSVLYRKLKALTGNSIQDFVRVVKLRKAARLLLESDQPISEIAFQSGFSNSKHFSTAFKRQFGKTPSEYRIKT